MHIGFSGNQYGMSEMQRLGIDSFLDDNLHFSNGNLSPNNMEIDE